METFKTEIPYAWMKGKPKQIDVQTMLDQVVRQLERWVDNLFPRFSESDALHLIDYEKREDCLYLKYEIIREKWSNID